MFPHLLDMPKFGVIDNKIITSVTIKSTLVKTHQITVLLLINMSSLVGFIRRILHRLQRFKGTFGFYYHNISHPLIVFMTVLFAGPHSESQMVDVDRLVIKDTHQKTL